MLKIAIGSIAALTSIAGAIVATGGCCNLQFCCGWCPFC